MQRQESPGCLNISAELSDHIQAEAHRDAVVHFKPSCNICSPSGREGHRTTAGVQMGSPETQPHFNHISAENLQ